MASVGGSPLSRRLVCRSPVMLLASEALATDADLECDQEMVRDFEADAGFAPDARLMTLWHA
jgi:hypothetical protein